MTDKHDGLATALAAAQASAHAVEKDATNSFHRYKYASAEAIIAEAKAALSGHGAALLPVEMSIVPAEALGSVAGGPAAILRTRWAILHGSDRHEMSADWPIIPDKGRPFDKAVAAARTASLGYLLRDLLQLPREEEGTGLDDDSRDRPDTSAADERLARERKAKMEADKAAAMAKGKTEKTEPPPAAPPPEVAEADLRQLIKLREAFANQKTSENVKMTAKGWAEEIGKLSQVAQRAALALAGAREVELAGGSFTAGQRKVLDRLDAFARTTTERG